MSRGSWLGGPFGISGTLTDSINRDLQTFAEGLGASENGECLEDRGMGALLGALERRQAGEIVILQLFGRSLRLS